MLLCPMVFHPSARAIAIASATARPARSLRPALGRGHRDVQESHGFHLPVGEAACEVDHVLVPAARLPRGCLHAVQLRQRVHAGRDATRLFLLARERDAFLEVGPGGRRVAKARTGEPQRLQHEAHEHAVVDLARDREALFELGARFGEESHESRPSARVVERARALPPRSGTRASTERITPRAKAIMPRLIQKVLREETRPQAEQGLPGALAPALRREDVVALEVEAPGTSAPASAPRARGAPRSRT
jgi:hypothetical protein